MRLDMEMRKWQSECAELAIKHYKTKKHFLCLATPGAGKTIMAAEIGHQLYLNRKIDYILCFAPSISVSTSIKKVFGRHLNAHFDGVIGSVGGVYTYQSMLFLGDRFWDIFKRNNVFVVFDEIHHCAGDSLINANSWGEKIITEIQGRATYTLALTGTPWRSDKHPITMSHYKKRGEDIICDYVYGLKEAVLDSVCRLPNIVLVDNDKLTLTGGGKGKKVFNSLSDMLKNTDMGYQDIITNEMAISYIIKLAIDRLSTIRTENPKAGGLIVASSVEHANVILDVLTTRYGQTAVIVTYKLPKSAQIIDNFRNSNVQWIVSVGMVSEGTDIPRLQVCCHLSRVKTELYFRQVLGRILRTNNEVNQDAWLYTFAEPNMAAFSHRLKLDVPDAKVVLDYKGVDKKTSTIQTEGNTLHKILKIDNFIFDAQSFHNSSDYELPYLNSTSNVEVLSFLGRFKTKIINYFD
ncbi:DEAD/DEAH box helicase [Raoultella planticola]|uniref:DEAD/DEAH box helicase n=1 Tax=Raoultella planticola TaxID=575 RepID=UPI00388E4F6E